MSLFDEWPSAISVRVRQHLRVFRYLLPAAAVFVAMLINWSIAPFLAFLPPYLMFLAAIMATSWWAGFSHALFATALSAIVIDFYFIPPLYTFNLKAADVGSIIFFAVEAVIMAYCIDYLHKSRLQALTSERQLRRFQELSGRLVEETTLDAMLEEVLKTSIELLGAQKGVVQLYDSRDDVLRLIKQLGFSNEFSTRFDRVPMGAFSCGTAFERKQRVIIEDVATDREFASLSSMFHEFGVRGAQSTPLFRPDGTVFGVLSTYWSGPYRSSVNDFQLLDLYAHQAERILLHKRNEERLYQATETLERSVTRKQVLLMERDARLAKLMSELLLTEERERRELAAELHDSLAQLLSLAKMKLSLVRASLVRPAEKAEQYVQETEEVVNRSIKFTRSLMAEFDPPQFEELGLPGALVWLKDRMQQHNLSVTLQLASDSVIVPHYQAVLLYKSIRELLMNVVKHAGVKTATIAMGMQAGHTLRITIKDEGRGFRMPTSDALKPERHFGLRSVGERIQDLGGKLRIESDIGKGCTVTITVPLQYTEADRAAETILKDRVITVQHDPHQQTLPLL
jgi:signal transduction histidine kinase